MQLNVDGGLRRRIKKTTKFSIPVIFIWLSAVTMASRGIMHSLASSSKSTCLSKVCSSSGSKPAFIMPKLFLGTLGINGVDDVTNAINGAISSGYRNFDFAPVYFNEHLIGDALQREIDANRVSREELFITSKLACPFHKKEHVEKALRKTLLDLRLDYLDMYLVHWPVTFHYVDFDSTQRGWVDESIDDSDGGKNIDPTVSIHETWAGMEELVEKGLVRNIGVSNFPVSLLHELLSQCRIPPAVNQVELHPYLQQPKLLQYCQARNVQVQAYSPLGTPGYKEQDEPLVLQDAVLQQMASDKQITVAQLCLAWALQRGTSVVSKSAQLHHQQQNIQVALNMTTILTDEEMDLISKLDRNYRFFRPEDWWGHMALAVFD